MECGRLLPLWLRTLREIRKLLRVIGRENTAEFEEIGALLVAKRQSISGSVEDIVTRWMSAGVILELTPLL